MNYLWVPPIPGISPSLSSGNPNLAYSEQKTISHKSESSQPPPNATPFTPAMIGFWVLYIVSWISLNTSLFLKSALDLFSNYLMLAPAQKAFLTLLKITMTLTSFDASNYLIFLTMLDFISDDRALKSFWLSM